MKVLELFAGSRSIGKVCDERGYQVFSSDIEDFNEINYIADILEFDYRKVPFVPDVIWASPPCTAFSVAAIGKNWNKDRTPKSKNAEYGMELVKKTTEIIDFYLKLNPELKWFIENPRGMLRKLNLVGGVRHTVTYCQYGDLRMKPTDIWTNSDWKPRKACKNGDSCHVSAPRGSRTGTQGLKGSYLRSQIPKELCEEVLCQ